MLTEIALAAALLAAGPTEAEMHALTRAKLETTLLERDAIATQAQILLLQERLRDLVIKTEAARVARQALADDLRRHHPLARIED